MLAILLDRSFAELSGLKLKIWEKSRFLFIPLGAPKHRTRHTKRSRQRLEKVLGNIKRKQHFCIKSHPVEDIFAILI